MFGHATHRYDALIGASVVIGGGHQGRVERASSRRVHVRLLDGSLVRCPIWQLLSAYRPEPGTSEPLTVQSEPKAA